MVIITRCQWLFSRWNRGTAQIGYMPVGLNRGSKSYLSKNEFLPPGKEDTEKSKK